MIVPKLGSLMRVVGARSVVARIGLVLTYCFTQVTCTSTALFCRLPPPEPQLAVEPVVVTQPAVRLMVKVVPPTTWSWCCEHVEGVRDGTHAVHLLRGEPGGDLAVLVVADEPGHRQQGVTEPEDEDREDEEGDDDLGHRQASVVAGGQTAGNQAIVYALDRHALIPP